MKEALFYEQRQENKVKCKLCNHYCLIANGKTGFCNVRENINGKLYSLVYEKPVAQSVDPIEKKPLFHFLPGSLSYSIATMGCNFRCLHCQNWDISQVDHEKLSLIRHRVSAEEIVNKAIQTHCASISYTYTEPTIFFEYAYDIAKLAHLKGLKNVFVTNGYISQDALTEISPFLDAANIDLKSMNDTFYKDICGARLQPVLDNIKKYHELGIWIEVTTLIIPGYNDNLAELQEIAEFIRGIDAEIPWHVTGFHPTYQLTDASPTSVEILRQAVSIGKEAGLRYVYQGNVREGEDTYCPLCGLKLITRDGFLVRENGIRKNRCPRCDTVIAGVGMDRMTK